MAAHQYITWQRALLFIVLAAVLLGLGWNRNLVTSSTSTHAGDETTAASWCRIPDRIADTEDGLEDSSKLFRGEDVLKLQVERLSAAVNISTESFDDKGDVDEDQRWWNFAELHDKLAELFPRVYVAHTYHSFFYFL